MNKQETVSLTPKEVWVRADVNKDPNSGCKEAVYDKSIKGYKLGVELKKQFGYFHTKEELEKIIGDACIKFLDTIRDYEHESKELICDDERSSEVLYNQAKDEGIFLTK